MISTLPLTKREREAPFQYSVRITTKLPMAGSHRGMMIRKTLSISTRCLRALIKDQFCILYPKPSPAYEGIPEQYGNAFQGVKAIVGEEPSLLPGTHGKQPVKESSSRPVAFQCPNCADNLTIDGTKRMVDCSFCDTQVYLPDDLWHTLHPVK